MGKMSWMSVDTTWFRDGISSEYLLNCKPVFCSTARWLSAKATMQQPLPQHSHCHSVWMHTPYLEGGWVQGAWPCSPSLLPERPSVLSASFLHACTDLVLDKIFHLNLLFLTHCHCFVHYETKKNPHFLPVRLNLSIKSKWKFIVQRQCTSLVTGLFPSQTSKGFYKPKQFINNFRWRIR